MNKPSDEIDFEPILTKIYVFFSKVLSSIFSFFPFVIRNLKKILIWSFIGALIGLGLSFIVKPYYRVHTTLSTTYLGSLFIDDFVNSANFLIETENYKPLAETLNLTVDEVESIEMFDYERLDVFIHFEDTVNSEYIYRISAEVYTQEYLEQIQKGVINSLENNLFTKTKREARRTYYQQSIQRLQKDILSLDTLIKKVEENIGKEQETNTIVLNEPINPSHLIDQKNRLSDKLIEFQQSLKTINIFMPIYPFNPLDKPTFPKKSIFTLIGSLCGFIASMVFIQFKNRLNP